MLNTRANTAVSTAECVAPNDVLSNVDLPLRSTYFPFGFPVEIASNSPAIMAAAEQSWRLFRPQFSCPPLVVELGVTDDDVAVTELPPAPVCRVRGHLLTHAADARNFVTCDLRNGYSFGWVTSAVVASPLYLRYHLLDAAVYAMISSTRAAALHAACVAPYGRGMMLCGDSGAGKSSLAFAGARAGWTYISDDASYLPLHLDDRTVVGNSHQIRFRDSGVQLFPELEGRSITPRATGKPSIEVSTFEFPELTISDSTRIEYIIFLNRRNAANPGLHAFPREIARQWFRQSPLYDASSPVHEAALNGLLDARIYELRYTDLDWAVEYLDQFVLEGK